MPVKKDIAGLLEEVEKLVQGLRDEKSELRDQVNRLEAQLALFKEEKSKEGRRLQDINDHLTKELQDTKIRLSGELQRTQEKLDRFHPELQSLQDELQNSELKNNLLEMKVSKKDEEIKSLEARLRTYTSLDSVSLSVEEPIV